MSAVIGQGPDLALIHGWGLDSAVWQPLLAALAQRFRVHLVDLPGYGAAPDDSADFTNTAQAVIDALPHPVTLCGWSVSYTHLDVYKRQACWWSIFSLQILGTGRGLPFSSIAT